MVIMFTDIVASTELIQELGDQDSYEIINRHDALVRSIVEDSNGMIIKNIGDGSIATFNDASTSVHTAIKIQRQVKEHSKQQKHKIKISIGINAGDPISANDDIHGISVNTASRICGFANGDEIVVSSNMNNLIYDQDFDIVDLGNVSLKGLNGLRNLFRIDWAI